MKTLIISHMPFLSYDAMGKTFCSLFSCFEKQELCQLYIYPSIPNVDKCESLYRITDKDVLKGLFKRKLGRVIENSEIDNAGSNLYENANDEKIYRTPKNKKPLRMLMRDAMWKISHWYSKNLVEWIKNEKPTVIFIAPGTAKFIYDIALKISKKFKLPIVGYICDDYYFIKDGGSFLKKRQIRLLQKKTEKLMARTSKIISISDQISRNYEGTFKVPCLTLMTGSSFSVDEAYKYYREEKRDDSALVYLGNVRCDRYKSLVDIGKALDRINKKHNTNYKLKIYTSEKNEEILNCLKSVKSITLSGYVSGEEFLQTLCSAEVLVHTESFGEEMIDLVKNSISTKIADSLASGRKFLAYGPKGIASIDYLNDNRLAFVATKESELEDVVYKSLTEDGHAIIDRARKFAKQNHDSQKNSLTLYSEMQSISGENEGTSG